MITKELVLDTETTSLGQDGSVVQIAAIYQENGVVKDEINLKFRPNPDKAVYPKALQVTKVKYTELMKRKLGQFEAYTLFLKFLDSKVNKYSTDVEQKMYLIGYNVQFDLEFLLSFFKDHGNNYLFSYFHWPALDISQILSWYTMKGGTRGKLENFKLGTVAAGLGIELEEGQELHDAMADVILTKKILDKLKEERD